MRKTIKKKNVNGYDMVEYLYECDKCGDECWSDSKRLFKRCPKCFIKRVNSRMRLAI
mgnify:CR=1 FL=1|tara:strand:+ start:617 stop:787 length:171 start_codon:yes stop_codon:yes gene_type:complete